MGSMAYLRANSSTTSWAMGGRHWTEVTSDPPSPEGGCSNIQVYTIAKVIQSINTCIVVRHLILSLSPLVVFVPASPGCGDSSGRKFAEKKKKKKKKKIIITIINDPLLLPPPPSLHCYSYLMQLGVLLMEGSSNLLPVDGGWNIQLDVPGDLLLLDGSLLCETKLKKKNGATMLKVSWSDHQHSLAGILREKIFTNFVVREPPVKGFLLTF